MKQYFIGFFTGACLVAVFLIFIEMKHGKIGKYQGFAREDGKYLIDTETGQLWKHDGNRAASSFSGWVKKRSVFKLDK